MKFPPALDLLHALQMIIPGLLCIVVSWNCFQKIDALENETPKQCFLFTIC